MYGRLFLRSGVTGTRRVCLGKLKWAWVYGFASIINTCVRERAECNLRCAKRYARNILWNLETILNAMADAVFLKRLLNGTFCHWKQFTCSAEQLTFEIMFIALYCSMIIKSAYKFNNFCLTQCFLQNASSFLHVCPRLFVSRFLFFVTFPDAFGSHAGCLPWKCLYPLLDT